MIVIMLITCIFGQLCIRVQVLFVQLSCTVLGVPAFWSGGLRKDNFPAGLTELVASRVFHIN